jgi:hypothetical protein
MRKHWFALSLGVLAWAFTPRIAAASVLYGIEFSTGTGFFNVNQSTGALNLIGSTGNDNTGDLTSNQSAIVWAPDLVNADLLTIDPATGAVSGTTPLVSGAGAGVPIVSLAWDPVTQSLYGNTAVGFGNTTADDLYLIDPATGLSTLVGTIGFNAVYALGFDQSGTLYGISNSSQELITINTATGAGSLIAPVNLTSAFDLAFRPEDNTMFVSDSGTSSLYTMNPGTGAETLVGSFGAPINNVGLAFVTAAVPEPGTVGLLLAGVALLGWKARKRANGFQPR